MFNKILIANRGEIACRIMRTAKNMGLQTVAIYSEVDQKSPHVMQADEAYYVGDAPAKASYLNIPAIIEVGIKSGAQAIHPGYGFLSENPEFAKACTRANLIFIGPTIEAMEAMASKQLAKQLLEKTSVPLTPGYHGINQSEECLLFEAKKIGFPVLLKAAAGGGGKGMRAVYAEEEFSAALAGAKREANASFADDTMIIEKLVKNPRHVEVQIMADNHGQVVHLFERDCSIQRRHQKIIEEAPAPHLSPAIRQGLAEAACEVARSIHYRGAGTVEFLVDNDEHFYFMEMNTRLQVEHPVTEMITGLDLVAWQIKIAANEPLPLKQEQIQSAGHAIECRIYAEDPTQQFIPSIGEITFLKEPSGIGIRIDTGIICQSQISQYYDPMIAKLIAWGENRKQALLRLNQALNQYIVGGVKTNIQFLKAICQNERFQKANLSTGFLNEETITLPTLEEQKIWLIAIGYDYYQLRNQEQDPLYHDCFSWQMHLKSAWVWRYFIAESMMEFKITPINDSEFWLEEKNNPPKHCHVVHNGQQLCVETEHFRLLAYIHENDAIEIYTSEGNSSVHRYDWRMNSQSATQSGHLLAPMPSTVVAVLKNKGDKVKKGEQLLVLEAMKMEHTIRAPQDGILTEIFYDVGSQVKEGEELLKLY